MKHIRVIEARKEKKVGRPKAVTKEQVLNAIRGYATDSVSILAEKLNVSRVTIYERMKEISRKNIDRILMALADSTLRPAEMDYTVFEQIPAVREYAERMLYNKKASNAYVKRRIQSLHKICCILKLRPSHLNKEHIEECALLVRKVERKEIKIQTTRGIEPMGLSATKKTLRSWFQVMHALSSQFLTSHGIPSSAFKKPERSRARLTREQRQAFMEVLKEKTKANWKLRKRSCVFSIKFGDEPHLRNRMLLLPKAFYYWGSRKQATLKARIEEMQWHNPMALQKVLDKGRRTWLKRIAGDLLREFKELHESLGKPKEGLWFPFFGDAVAELFKECYREAGIPEKLWKGMPLHIWRHTACQDLLEATDYNYELTAEILGWESIDTMKRYYGKMGEKTVDKGFLRSMGIEVPEEQKEFRF